MIWKTSSLLALLLVSGCVFGIPDSGPPPVHNEPCEVVVKDDQGHTECVSRVKFQKWLCRTTGEC